MFHLQLILSQGSCKGVAHAKIGLCIGLGPPGTLRLILARLFGSGSVHALTGLGPPGTLRLILAWLFGSGSVHALTGLCIGLGPPGTLRLILARLLDRKSTRLNSSH